MYSDLGDEVHGASTWDALRTEAKPTTALPRDAQPWMAWEVADVNFPS